MKLGLLLALLFCVMVVPAQPTYYFADSIRRQHNIPEIAYAVISADSIYEIKVLGVRKIHSSLVATTNDRFRLGSNTKAITGFIAALLVKQGKINWDTKFFDLFPELKPGSRKEYHQLTLLDLLSFRARLFSYTYTYTRPVRGQFSGSASEQRYQFARWFLKQPPVGGNDSVNFSNLAYVAAGLMLEKASRMAYQELVAELGDSLGIQFGFGRPNTADPMQTCGHGAKLKPEERADDYKLDWLQVAGNINCTLPDYIKFIQLQLKGLKGQSTMLTQQEFEFLHFGMARFAVGWLPATDNRYGAYSFNIGNPGTFLSKVYVYRDIDRAFILLANAQTDAADEGLDILYEELKRRYAGR